MKKNFKQQLEDYLFLIITQNNWDVEWACEKELNNLLEQSIEKISHRDCAKQEVLQYAKTNLLHLLAHMHLDAKGRGLYYMDRSSIINALYNFNSLWPFKGSDATPQKRVATVKHNEVFNWYY